MAMLGEITDELRQVWEQLRLGSRPLDRAACDALRDQLAARLKAEHFYEARMNQKIQGYERCDWTDDDWRRLAEQELAAP